MCALHARVRVEAPGQRGEPFGHRRVAGGVLPRRRIWARGSGELRSTGMNKERSRRDRNSPWSSWERRGSELRPEMAEIKFVGGETWRKGTGPPRRPGASQQARVSEEEERATAEL